MKLLEILLLNNFIKGCPVDEPILDRFDNCTSKYCTNDDFNKGECKIDNDIIRAQWLNRMNIIATNGFIFVSMAAFSDGGLILGTIKGNEDKKRYFYGLNKNGNNFFENKGRSSVLAEANNNLGKDYFNIFTVFSNKENNSDKKEYLILIPNESNKIELYDFETLKFNIQTLPDSIIGISNIKYMPLKIIEEDKIFTIFPALISNNFTLLKLNVDDSNIIKPFVQIIGTSQTYSQTGIMASCFETINKKIICFFRDNTEYQIIAFNYNLEEENQEVFNATTSEFFKCVHVKENIGGFLYFSGSYPIILFMEYKNETFESLNEVKLDFNSFEDTIKRNDFIKISDNKISFIGYEESGILYVVLMKFIEPDNDIVIRYYSIDLKNLYDHYICCDIVVHNYNNYIALSFNTHEYIRDNRSEHNIIFMKFSYPSINDNTIDLENHIFNNDRLNSYKFETNLRQFVFIENNIFGYIYSKIKIIEIKGCEMFNIILNKNETLKIDYILKNGDNIKLILLNKYKPFSCQIKYIFYATELDYKQSYKYAIHEEIISNNNSFNEESYNNQREIYEGREGFYKIELKNNLSDTCEGNCRFCSINSNKKMIKCLICKYDSEIKFNSGKREKICLDKSKSSSKPLNEIMNNLDELLEGTDPEVSYVISGVGYTAIIKDINEYVEDSTVNIDFTKCEEKLRLNLPENIKLRILQLNIEKEDEKSLTDQVEYKVYDEAGNSIDLTVCNDVEINIEYEITDTSALDLDLISKFSDLGVDVFNINDKFFNDICRPYSDDGSNSDMILSDRVSDIYQNVSLCGDDCDYVSFDLKKMSVNCNCKVKQEASDEPEKGNFASSITSAFLDSNFGVIKCYKLVFSLKGKLKNAGFWIFVIFIIFEIVIYIYYCYTGILPIKNYIEKEMKENGYKVNENEDNKDNTNYKGIENEQKESKNQNNPPKKKGMAKNKIKWINFSFKKEDTNSFNMNTEEAPEKDYDKNTEPVDKVSYNSKKTGVYSKFNKNRNRIKNNKMNINNIGSKEIMSTNEEININKEKKIIPIKRKEGDHLIFINAKNTDNYIPLNSLYNLDNYDYEEAIEYEGRSFGRIFFIYLMSKEGILNTFYYQQPLELKPLRILMFIFSNACDIALNCFFYLSDNISDKYHYEGKSAILFSLTNNITISLVSSIVGYCLIYFSQSLVQSTDKITILFREQDNLLKKDKHYTVESKKNMDIIKEIKKILKCLKLKITIFLIFENLLMIFFFYYVTAFCHVYNSTQTSWLLDSLTSYGISLLTAFAVSFFMSLLYEIAINCKCRILYKITIFIYNGI